MGVERGALSSLSIDRQGSRYRRRSVEAAVVYARERLDAERIQQWEQLGMVWSHHVAWDRNANDSGR
ncbi:hypothetical protein ABZX95_36230 [Streptomyces sp. NPDC004232]|uniref:hypothetical protein n=1 Tax=Streptomyces sp. NPDC004232 TaxID=3154454 RepID=UPI001D826B4C|nr:hypothetical protein [Streptomyces sp. tea 10]